jgi:hypothetical protein
MYIFFITYIFFYTERNNLELKIINIREITNIVTKKRNQLINLSSIM